MGDRNKRVKKRGNSVTCGKIQSLQQCPYSYFKGIGSQDEYLLRAYDIK